MANTKSDYVKGTKPVPTCKGSETLSIRVALVLAAFALNDVLELIHLPEDHVPCDWTIDTDDLDSNGAPAATFDVGILNAALTAVSAAAADGGAKWATALTTAQAGGLVRMSNTAPTRVVPSATSRRTVGIVVAAASATFQAGTFGMTLWYRAAYQGA